MSTKMASLHRQTEQRSAMVWYSYFAFCINRPIDTLPSFITTNKGDTDNATLLWFFIAAFLIAHEFAHIVFGHLKPEKTVRLLHTVASRAQKSELQADLLGAKFVHAIRDETPFKYIAPLLVTMVFGCFDHTSTLCETIVLGALNKGRGRSMSLQDIVRQARILEENKTHPVGAARYRYLIENLHQNDRSLPIRFSMSLYETFEQSMYDFSEGALRILRDVSTKIGSDLPAGAGFIKILNSIRSDDRRQNKGNPNLFRRAFRWKT
jgi:hypothetical protein